MPPTVSATGQAARSWILPIDTQGAVINGKDHYLVTRHKGSQNG